MMDKIGAEELEAWRTLRPTITLSRLVEERRKQLALEMRQASVDGTLDRVRRVSGALEQVEWLANAINVKGAIEP